MKWILGILCLFFLILFHEFGHFLAAKLFGVKVESFSIGFGPILLHKTVKGTDYRLSLFPLGGYCGMKGEKDFQKAIEEDLDEIQADKDSLYGIHPVKRALIGFAGPFFNLIFAIICYSLIAGIGYTYSTYSNKIILANEIYPEIESVAASAGIKTGDKIIKVNNTNIPDFSTLIEEISTRPDEDITLTVDRNGEILTFSLHTQLDTKQGTGKIGVSADVETLIEKESERYSFFGAIIQGFKETYKSIILTFKSIAVLFKGVELKNAVSGPARVTDILGTTVQAGFSAGIRQGFVSMFSLMAIISISLFIMNLLPIPVLDGGLILIVIIELIIRKKIKPKIQYYIQFIGIAFIAILFFIGLSGDISYFINRSSLK